MRNPLATIAPLAAVVIALVASPAWAVKVADITRISGQRTNELNGWGLVVGLKGTGDGSDYQAAMKPLATLLGKLGDATTVKELANSQNIAVVTVHATIPKDGVRDGDEINCYVESFGAATSLKGGRLFTAPMMGPTPNSGIFALAHGSVFIEDPSTPTHGVIKNGCVMEADLPARYVDNGRFTLIIEDPSAGWGTANAIAQIINQEAGTGDKADVAYAVDPKNVVVVIPPEERANYASFIHRVQALPVQVETTAAEARVVINDSSGTMLFTADVEISPVVIIHNGLTISTTTPPPVPSAARPVVARKDAVPVATSAAAGAKLQDLVNALDQLKVPAVDRIEIVKELYKTGKLHAKLLIE